MKALFQLKEVGTGKLSKETFTDKDLAKKARKGLNPKKEDQEVLNWVVVPGPDHWQRKA